MNNAFYPAFGVPGEIPLVGNQLVKVNGLEGAKAYQVPANSCVAIFDANEDFFYVKTTGASGFPSLRMFKFEEVDMSQNTEYVTRKEFQELKELVLNGRQLVRAEAE